MLLWDWVQNYGRWNPCFVGSINGLTSLIPLIGTGFELLAWGAFIVHPADNVLHPLLISNVRDIPLLIVLFGVLGGLLAFGMIGMFLGPLILAVFLAIFWREWLGDDQVKNL